MKIAAGVFKAQCLRLMEEVRSGHKTFEITKRGQPVARLVPIDDAPPVLFGRLAGRVSIVGDIVAPIDEPWEADQ